MPLADYAHWNEDAEFMWWQEEGRHNPTESECDDDSWRDEPPPDDEDEDD